MSILDKLVEKKDLEAYLGLRAAFLRNEMTDELQKQPDSKKELIRERFNGRILELNSFKQVVISNNIKRDSKRYYKATHAVDEV
jgi:hypothetical protein